jgi:sulfur-carrier protein
VLALNHLVSFSRPMTTSQLASQDGTRAQTITVSILYFARLKEALGQASEKLVLPASVTTVRSLREYLHNRGGAWASELASARPVRIAVNQDLVSNEAVLKEGDEVAFFPPVTGG